MLACAYGAGLPARQEGEMCIREDPIPLRCIRPVGFVPAPEKTQNVSEMRSSRVGSSGGGKVGAFDYSGGKSVLPVREGGTRRAWDVGQRAAEGAGGAGEPDRDDPPEGRERGHSAASGTLFQDDVETLPEPAKDLGELRRAETGRAPSGGNRSGLWSARKPRPAAT